MYLGGTIYRIHGIISLRPSADRFRAAVSAVNEDVIDLYGHVNVGAKVVGCWPNAAQMPMLGPDPVLRVGRRQPRLRSFAPLTLLPLVRSAHMRTPP
jgi:hypothetical protein